MPLSGNDYFLFNALSGGSGANSGGAGGQSATGAQYTAAVQAAGIGGSLMGAGFNPAGRQDQAMALQNQATKQKISLQKQIMDLLLGNFSGSASAKGSTGGVGSLLDQLATAGQGTRAVINENFKNLASSTLSRFDQYGMGGSSGVPSVLAGIERQKSLALGELDDKMVMEKIGVQERGMDRAIELQKVLASLLG